MNATPPTFSTKEAMQMMGYLDRDGLILLGQVLTEEMKQYSLNDLELLKQIWDIKMVERPI